jgi:catechol 2,3-dioxygenase-like lactoylglutathione lyase family enzyme
MKFKQIKETSIYVTNLHSSENFYSGLLGLEIIAHVENRHIFFRAGTSVLLCFISESTKNETTLPYHYASGKIHFAFEVAKEDYEKSKTEITSKGINIEHEHEWKEGVRSFYFRDPDGHLLEIVPSGMWEN